MSRRETLYTGTPLEWDDDFPRLTDVLLRAARRHPRAGVVVAGDADGDRLVAYPDLLDQARRILTLLRRNGARAGHHAIVCGHDDASGYLAAYWGCVLGGIRPLLAAPGHEAAAAAATSGLLGRSAELLGDAVVLCGPRSHGVLAGRLRCLETSAAAAESPAVDLHRAEPAEVAMLMTSSGSTGVPKLIQLTQRGLAEFAVGTVTMLPVGPDDVMLNWLPLDHSGAFLLYHLLAVFHGATNVHAPTDVVLADPLVWLDLIQKHRVDHTWAPNFGFRLVSQALTGRPDGQWDLSSLRTLVSGGEQITVPVVEEFLRRTAAFGLRPETFRPAWGMTETTTGITFARPGLTPNVRRVRTGSLDDARPPAAATASTTFVAVGAPAPGTVLRVVGEDGTPVPEGRIGALQVASARVTPGYLRDPEADARAFTTDGTGTRWLNTGDLAFGGDGQIFIVGRQDDRIVLRGRNHYAYEIESEAERAPGVRDGTVAACGVPDAGSGTEILVVFLAVDAADDAAALVRAVQDVLFRRLGLTARVVAVAPDAIPRTASGKVQRGRLRDRLLGGELSIVADSARAGGSAAGVAQPRHAVVREVFRAVLGRDVDERARFYEVGIDSVSLTRLHAELQRALGVDFARSAMFEHPSMAALIDHLGGGPGPGGAAGRPVHAPDTAEHRVAVVGMAVRLPGAETLEQYWANLVAGVRSVRTFTAQELAAAGVPTDVSSSADFVPAAGALAGIEEFDAEFFGISPAEAARTDPAHRLFLQCCYHALEHAGYAAGTGAGRVGVYAGSGMNLYTHQNYLLGNLLPGADGDPIEAMQAAIGTQPDFLATRVAYHLNLTGPAIGVQTACSTSLVAVHLAVQALLTGEADMALAGAAAVHVPQVTGYRRFPGSILSPTGRCRAFDASADGTVGGSGTAAVLLKRLDRAIADGDTIHAVILGSAVNNDGGGKVGFTAPGVAGQAEVIGRALDRAGVPAETITYLEAHGTGTALGDPVEWRAASRALAERTDRVGFCTVGSVKPNIGHLDSCAGMAGLIKTVLMLEHGTLVPLADFERANPELDLEGGPLVLGTTVREWTTGGAPRRAGVTALGVGGTNAHVVVEQAPAHRPAARRDDRAWPRVVPLSAAHPDALAELVGRMRDHLLAHPRLAVPDVVTTAALGRPHLRYRTAVVGATGAELADALRAAPTVDAAAGGSPTVAFAFGGQGSARPGMAAELYEAVPAFRDVLDECEQVYRAETGRGLLTYLCGDGPGTVGAATDLAQPAIFAHQVAHAAMWRSLGVTPSFVVGHSVGEYAALCVAGAITVADGLRLVAARGRLMQRTPPGAMIAVRADRAVVDDLLAATAVELAAVNGPADHVVAGPEDAVDEAADRLDARAIAWHRVGVDRAFHTALLDPVLGELAGHAAAAPVRPLDVPLASTLTGTVLAAGTVVTPEHLVRQAREPVRFADALAGLVEAGCETYLEISADAVLSGIGRRSGAGRKWIPVTRPGTDPLHALSLAVAEMYLAGADPDWSQLAGGRRVPLPGYPFRRDRHWTAGPSSTSSRSAAPVAVAGAVAGAVAAAPHREPVPGPAAVLATIRELTAAELGVEPARVGADATFLDHGADSLTMLRVVQQVRQSFGVDIAVRRLFTDAATPRRLAEVVCDAPETGPAGAHAGAPPPGSVPETVDSAAAEESAWATRIQPVLAEQLRVAGQLVENVGSLMRDQMSMLRDHLATAGNPPAAVPDRPPAPRQMPTVEVRATAVTPPTTRAATDFSLYFFGDYPDQRQEAKYEAIVAAARFADEHGFHGVWLPERHFHSFGGLFPNPVVIAAALARETSRIRINAGSVVLPLHHPIRVAEEWSVVDNLSAGRIGLCVASGWHANDFALEPEAFGRHRELMFEHLETVRRLWAGEAVPATSGTGDPIEVRVFPRPVQPMPPLSVAVVSNPDSYRAAAAAGIGVVTNLMVQSIEQLADNIALYRRTRAEHGLDPAGGRVVVLVHTYLGADVDAVRAQAYQPFCAYLRSSLSLFGQVTNSLGMSIGPDTPSADVDFLLDQAYRRYCAERALIGTPETASPIIERLTSAGADEIACFIDFGLPADRMLQSLRFLDDTRRRHAGDDRHDEPAVPLSAAQRGMWFLEQLRPGTRNYHEPKAVRLDGPLDVARLRWSLHRVIDRHAPLRTVFRAADGRTRQVVLSSVAVALPVQDLPGTAEDEALRSALNDLGAEPFDLASGPLLRGVLIRLGPQRHLLVLCVHHIVFDSFSTAVLLRDLAAYYRSGPAHPDPLPALTTTYPDHVVARALDETAAERSRSYWRRTLTDAPPLSLPVEVDRPRSLDEVRGTSLTLDWDAELAAGVARLSRLHQVTPFMTLSAAIGAVLGRLGGQEDLVLGTALSHRPPGTEDLVGLFIDSVPLRIDLTGDPTLGALAQRLRDVSTEAYEHAGIGFDEMVAAVNPEREPGRNPLFQVLVEYENRAEADFDPPLRATVLDVPTDRAPLDITVYLSNHAQGIQCHVEYDAGLLDERTLRDLLRYAEVVLRRAVADPGLRLAALTAPTGADRAKLTAWAGTRHERPPVCLHRLFEEQARRSPDAAALLTDDGPVSYRELDRRANALAWRLHEAGVRADELVGISLPRGVDLIVALLGVLKSGAAYLPLDRAAPRARLAFMTADSGARMILTDDATLPAELGLPSPAVHGDHRRSAEPPPAAADPEQLAYCIYTSGSTGTPKGVAVPHRGPANLVTHYLRTRPALRTLQWTSPSFDVSVQEIFTALSSGAGLVLIPDEARYQPSAVVDTVRRFGVERLFMTFTALKYLIETHPDMPSLGEIVSAGEPMVLTAALRSFLAGHPHCALYNEYGPTEASIIATVHRVDPAAGDRPPIGRPVDNVEVHVLDDRQRPVPPGAIGEIHLGGCGLAREYLGRPTETAHAFLTGHGAPAGRLYRTRDRGRWLPDGTLQYLGRTDDQVKIRGFRVEPGEALRALLDLPDVRDAAVVAGTDQRGDPCLIGYVVPAPDASAISGTELARRLADTLPGYLVPTAWVLLAELPVTAGGKLDRAALPPPQDSGGTDGPAPVTDTEKALHEIWSEELNRDETAVDASFFAVGGHSLTAVSLVGRIGERLGVELSVAELFRAPTIRGLAAEIDRRTTTRTDPASSFQQRAWRLHRGSERPAVYNVAHRVDLEGPLDVDALRRTLTEIAERHPILRTGFDETAGQLRQVVLPELTVDLPVIDLADDPDGVDAWCHAEARVPFVLDRTPPWRVRLARLGADRWLLTLVLHHIICDAWSIGVLAGELGALYRARTTGERAALDEPPAYREYVRWRQAAGEREHDRLAAFWRARLAGAELTLPLPYDRPRPPQLSGRGALHRLAFPAEVVEGVQRTARECGATPAAVLTASFGVWIGRLCDRTDVVLALSSAGRTRPEHALVAGPVGEAVLVRLSRSDGMSFADLVAQAGARTFEALDHHLLPLGEVSRLVGDEIRTPQVLFTVVTTPPPAPTLPGLTARMTSVPVTGVARTELYVVLVPADGGIGMTFEYSTDLFDERTVQGWGSQFVATVRELVVDTARAL